MGKTATDGTGILIRAATAADLPAVISLAALYDTAIIGEPDTDESDFADAWNNPRTRISDDVWVAVNPDEDLVAYEHSVDPAGNGRLEIEDSCTPIGRAEASVRFSWQEPYGVRANWLTACLPLLAGSSGWEHSRRICRPVE